jgi:two-component system, OmpR family, sensor histidine kinase KdpD
MRLLYPYRHYMVSIVLLASITLVSQAFRTELGLINIALIHLIPVIVMALRGNMGSTMVGDRRFRCLMFDLFYVPPKYSFDVHDLYLYMEFYYLFCGGIYD